MTTFSVAPMGVVAPVCVEWQWPPYAPPSRGSLVGGLVLLSPSVMKMAASQQFSVGDPLATAGVWRVLTVDLSLRESGESRSAQVNTRILGTIPLLVKLICTCTCTHVSCNNRLYCEWRYLSIWREIHCRRWMQYMVRCRIKVLELILLKSMCNTSLASAQALEWLCVPVKHVHQV